MPSGPLVGIRVLEFTQIIAGPFGCQNLADMGADVIKVEPAEGEPWRQFSQFIPGESKWFQTLNRGKRSLVLALQEPEAREIVYRLVPQVDVVVINYRPDVAGRLGIDYDTLKALRPDLIYVDNTAFGRRGPWAARPGYDIVAQGVSGLMVGEGKFNQATGAPEAISSSAMADYGTGLVIAWAVCAALFHRERTGEGQLVETSLLQTALAFQNSLVFDLPAADAANHARMDRVHQLQAAGASYPELLAAHSPLASLREVNIYYRPYQTSDGAVVIGALSPSLWAKVRAALDTDFLGIADPAFNPLDPRVAGGRQAQSRRDRGEGPKWDHGRVAGALRGSRRALRAGQLPRRHGRQRAGPGKRNGRRFRARHQRPPAAGGPADADVGVAARGTGLVATARPGHRRGTRGCRLFSGTDRRVAVARDYRLGMRPCARGIGALPR